MAAKMMVRKESAAAAAAAAAQGNGVEAQSPPPPAAAAKTNEVMSAKCECCGLTEECTEAYAAKVRERNQGRWICGLCAEAVKDEMIRSERRIGSEEALKRHMTFYNKFKAQSPPPKPTEELILAVKQLLLRSLDSPRSSPVRKQGLLRSQSCFSSIDG